MAKSVVRQKELACIRRTAKLVWALAHGEGLTIAHVMALTGLTREGSRYMLNEISGVLPIYCDSGVWQVVDMKELDVDDGR